MKKALPAILFFALTLTAGAQNIKDSSVLVSAVADKNAGTITLNWTTTDASGFQINRKTPETNSWGTVLAQVSGSSSSYVDATVAKNKIYEYRILKIKSNQVRAVGYVASGIDVPLTHYKKNILILVDSVTYNSIDSNTWNTLKNDYYMDGYGVKLSLVSRNATPVQVKNLISVWYNVNKSLNKHCVLIGQVPVAYSGSQVPLTIDTPPDGHTEHGGAWPTDLYYAEFDGVWTDNGTMVSGVGRTENKNVPGDGKLDQHFIPNDIDIQIGRIDLRNLPSQPLSEIQLIRQYLNKLHAFKTGQINPGTKGFLSDNFGYLGGEMPMRSGWNNLSAIAGANNIQSNGNYFDSSKANSYLWSNFMGPGSYSSCSGVGNSANFKDSIRSVFNVSFGSYFGDWDNSDNFLRSCLASKGFTLTNVWAHRPHWYFHQMAMGMNIGHSVITSQNNLTDFTLSTSYIGSFSGNYLDRRISMNLMGDPTLRLRYFAGPKNPVATAVNNNTRVSISWGASTEPGIAGYNIYRTSRKNDVYYLINSAPVSGLSFTDSFPYNGTNYYVVKAVKMETSVCGTYMNSSLGAMAIANNVNGNNTSVDHTPLSQCFIYPNPANGSFNLNGENGIVYSVHDVNGREITSGTMTDNQISVATTHWAAGIYIVRFSDGVRQRTEKLVIQ